MLGVTGLCFAAWQLSSYSNQRNNTASGVKEVYISKDAIYLNNKFYTWRAPLPHFISVTQEINRGLPVLVFRYTLLAERNHKLTKPACPSRLAKSKQLTELLSKSTSKARCSCYFLILQNVISI